MTIPMERQSATTVQRYADLLSDAGFKAVFGEQRNKDVLMDLLNVLLPRERRVRDVTYATTELPGFSPFNKSVRLDLRCTGEDGTEFIVEVQCYRQRNLFKRCVLYASQVYASGSRKGDRQEYDIPPVYFICLLGGNAMIADRDCPVWRDKFVSEYTFREKDSGEMPDETIFTIFVELNRFGKALEECVSPVEKWCYALKHVGNLDGLPDGLRVEAFERLFRACEISKFDKEQKLSYEKNMITERDYYNIIDTAREDGIEIGMERGIEQGIEKGVEKVAKELKSMGVPVETIISATGLAEEKVKRL